MEEVALMRQPVPRAGLQAVPGPSSRAPAGRVAGHSGLTMPDPGVGELHAWLSPSRCHESSRTGCPVACSSMGTHTFSTKFQLDQLPTPARAGLPSHPTMLVGFPRARPPALPSCPALPLGDSALAELGGLVVAWLSCEGGQVWMQQGCRLCWSLCSQPPGPPAPRSAYHVV